MTEFEIKNMSCGHCVGAITKAVKQLDPAATVETDLASKIVKVESNQSREVLVAALTDAGYAPA
ncbi:MAG: heavy-metal-associated domain-containing protein [Polaromonas sp.]|nr:heavy-metal-associated domain-containing protein [Polaromonas sp.]